MEMIITALISGLLATLVTIYWQKRAETRQMKLEIFRTLMSYRYRLHSEECVKALNSVDVIFYKDQKVRQAYSSFLDEANKDPETTPNFNIQDKHLKLLEEMSISLKLNGIQWDTIKRFYYPRGLSSKFDEEESLRKLQLDRETKGLEEQKEGDVMSEDMFSQQLAMQLLPELIKNPDSLNGLMDLAEKFK